ncbi:uncharacterized protein LOC131158640 [Malania oleifera]|uniref:uncharacterized protein LOC131158640 n=1 Tax=Malania oleifera TaxID=397392 RepID=UPI0025ADF0E6|nr:uncharacterized protein LOC131158640 [Malania oleifera]
MVEIAQSSKEQGGSSIAQGCTIEKFMKMNPPAFSGAIDPTVAENWMQEIENILTVLHYTNEQRVLYATYYLASFREAKVQEFLSLSEGLMTVQQYAVKFIQLSCFYPYIFLDEAKKVRMVERNLKQDIYRQVAILKIQDFSKLVNRAIIAEEGLSRETEIQIQK